MMFNYRAKGFYGNKKAVIKGLKFLEEDISSRFGDTRDLRCHSDFIAAKQVADGDTIDPDQPKTWQPYIDTLENLLEHARINEHGNYDELKRAVEATRGLILIKAGQIRYR